MISKSRKYTKKGKGKILFENSGHVCYSCISYIVLRLASLSVHPSLMCGHLQHLDLSLNLNLPRTPGTEPW